MGIWFSGFVIAGAGFIGGTWEIIWPRHLHCAGGERGLVSGSSEILKLRLLVICGLWVQV